MAKELTGEQLGIVDSIGAGIGVIIAYVSRQKDVPIFSNQYVDIGLGIGGALLGYFTDWGIASDIIETFGVGMIIGGAL